MSEAVYRARFIFVLTFVICLHSVLLLNTPQPVKQSRHTLTPQVMTAVLMSQPVSRSITPSSIEPSQHLSSLAETHSSTIPIEKNTNAVDMNRKVFNTKRRNIKASEAKTSETKTSETKTKAVDTNAADTHAVDINMSEALHDSLSSSLTTYPHIPDIKGEAFAQLSQPRFKGQRPLPDYPRHARVLSQEGLVVIKVFINSLGDVIQTEVKQSSDFDALDLAAKNAAQRARFYPYLRNGVAENSYAELTFNFVLK